MTSQAALGRLLLVFLFYAAQGSEHCKVTFDKVGCYSDSATNRSLPELLVTDRDSSHSNFGKAFNWSDFEGSLRSLLCRCSDEARRRGYRYIGIQYYAECWGGPTTSNYALLGRSTQCMQSYSTYDKVVCNFTLQQDCAGMGLTNFVYDLLDCWEMVDIAVLFDISSSMQGTALTTAKQFLKAFVNSLKISQQGTHIGLITFSKTARIVFDFKSPLNNEKNSEKLKEAIDSISSPSGTTWPDKAFNLAGSTLFTKEHGARMDVPKFIITISDGFISYESVVYPVMYSLQHNKGINLLSVGVGTDFNAFEVKVLALEKQQNAIDGNRGDAVESVARRIKSIAQANCDS